MARGRSEFRLRLVAEEVGRASAEFQKFGQLSQEALDRLKLAINPVNDNLRKADDAASKFRTGLRETAASIAVLDGPLGGMASRLNALATTIGSAGLLIGGLGVAAATASFAFVKLTQATGDFERSQLRLQNVLKATGNEAFVTLKEINDVALELARETLTSIDEMRTAGAAVLTSPNIRGVEDVERILRLAQDFTEVFAGTSLRENARFLGAAFDSPISAFDNLRERGIKLSDQLRETLRTLEESGQRAQAAEILFAELERRVGGAGEIGGLPGTLNQVSVELQRNIELFGQLFGVADAVQSVMQQVADSQRALGDAIEGYLRPTVQSLEEDLARLREERDALRATPPGQIGAEFGDIRPEPASEERELTAQIDALQRQLSERGAETTAQQRSRDFAVQAREVQALVDQEQRLTEALDAVSKAFTPQRETQLQKILEAGGGEAGLGAEGVAEVEQAFERQRLIAEEIKEAQRLGREAAQEQKRALEEAKQLAERFDDALRSLRPKTAERGFEDLLDRVQGSGGAALGEERVAELRRAYGEQIHREEMDREREKLSERIKNEAEAAQAIVEQGRKAQEARENQERVRIDRQIQRLTERLDPLAEFRRVDAELQRRSARALEPEAAGQTERLRQLNLQDLELPAHLQAIENAGVQAFNTVGDAVLDAAKNVRDMDDAIEALQTTMSSLLDQFAQTLLQVAVIQPLAQGLGTALRGSFAQTPTPAGFAAGAAQTGVQAGATSFFSRFFAGGFAEGGSFTVPGVDTGRDSVLTSMMTRPGERVTVDPAGASGPAGTNAQATMRMILETPAGPEAAASRLQQFGEQLVVRASDHAFRRMLDAASRERTVIRTFRRR